jgi:hypothetical protein
MEMNPHQQRLWQNMILLIESYVEGKNQDFSDVVGKLEGALDASEIKDNDLINQWYDFWTPLEIHCSIEGKNVNKELALQELKAMKNFLVKFKR